jgi:signal transduction histidine kinase
VLEVGDDTRFQYRDEARREGLRSMLSCPMRAKNRTLGVIRVYTAAPHVFEEQEESLLMNLANLGAVAIENARSYSELQTLDQERVWFARTTHHQLRSPLAAARAAIEALPFAGQLNETQQDLLVRAKRRIQDSFDTIRDLLDLAAAQRMEDGAALKPVRFEESVRRILETIREQARGKGLEFVEKLQTPDAFLLADPADIERVFSNLLSNAVKYTSAGRVAFGTACRDDFLEAWVEDTGIGISDDDKSRVFGAFYRTVAARATGEVGTGLGLSIVRQIVERLGGSIVVASEVNKGTKFTVRIPLSAPESPLVGVEN